MIRFCVDEVQVPWNYTVGYRLHLLVQPLILQSDLSYILQSSLHTLLLCLIHRFRKRLLLNLRDVLLDQSWSTFPNRASRFDPMHSSFHLPSSCRARFVKARNIWVTEGCLLLPNYSFIAHVDIPSELIAQLQFIQRTRRSVRLVFRLRDEHINNPCFLRSARLTWYDLESRTQYATQAHHICSIQIITVLYCRSSDVKVWMRWSPFNSFLSTVFFILWRSFRFLTHSCTRVLCTF